MGSIYSDGNKVRTIYYDTAKVKKVYYDTTLVWSAEEHSTNVLSLTSVDPYYATPVTTFSFGLRPLIMTCSYNINTKNGDKWLRHAYVILHGVRADGTKVAVSLTDNQISLPAGSKSKSGSLTMNCSVPNNEMFIKYQVSLQTHGYEMNWGNATNIKFTSYYKEV